MEQQQLSALVLLDVSTAFKTVDHDILFEVLNKVFDISGSVLNWVEEYLHPCFFKVCITNEYSSECELSFYVPQGSINGSTLFHSYSSTIRDVIDQDITVNAFADDHSLKKSFKPTKQSEYNIIKRLNIT